MTEYYKIDKICIHSALGNLDLSTEEKPLFVDMVNNEILNDPKFYLLHKDAPHVKLVINDRDIKFYYKEND